MEEIARDPAVPLDTDAYKKARFSLYTIEKELLARVLRRDKTEKLRGLYVIVDSVSLQGRSHVEVAGQAIEGGAMVIQLRDKEHGKRELLSIAQALRDLCTRNGVLFIVNDHIDIAIAVDADGVHIGREDLPVGVVRRLLPIDKILGCSAHTVDEAIAAQSEGADYIAVGAVFPSPTKPDAESVGTVRVKKIKEMVSIPVVAIGGVNEKNAGEVFAAGADAVAVISAISNDADVAAASRRIAGAIQGREKHG
jgi:thiamine-phosphate pyrophosphorylase